MKKRFRIKLDLNGVFDRYGVVIKITKSSFKNVDSFLTNLLGKPKLHAEKNLDGEPHSVYWSKSGFYHLQLIGDGKDLKLICVNSKHKRQNPKKRQAKRSSNSVLRSK